MVFLEKCPFSAVAPYKGVAARDRVSISDTRGTAWYLCRGNTRKDRAIIGFCGIIYSATRARVKGIYVFPEYRGRGLGSEMTSLLCTLATGEARRRGCTELEAFAHAPAWYLRKGWAKHGQLKNGAAIVRKAISAPVAAAAEVEGT